MGSNVVATYKVSGLAALQAKLSEMGKLDDGKAARSAAKSGVKPIVDQAKALIPKSPLTAKSYKGKTIEPGFAAHNIRTISQLKKSKSLVRASVGVRDEAFYAVNFVERGTKYQKAQHWLSQASEQTIEKQLTAVESSLQASVNKVSKVK